MKDKIDTNKMGKLERFNELLGILKGRKETKTQISIAKALDIDPSNLSKASNGDERYFTDSFLKKFAETFDFNVEQLLNGKEEIIKNKNSKRGVRALSKEIEEIKKTNEEIIANQKGTLLFLSTMMDKIFTKFDINISSAEQKEIKEVIKNANLN